jgi:hypothetical protein
VVLHKGKKETIKGLKLPKASASPFPGGPPGGFPGGKVPQPPPNPGPGDK